MGIEKLRQKDAGRFSFTAGVTYDINISILDIVTWVSKEPFAACL